MEWATGEEGTSRYGGRSFICAVRHKHLWEFAFMLCQTPAITSLEGTLAIEHEFPSIIFIRELFRERLRRMQV